MSSPATLHSAFWNANGLIKSRNELQIFAQQFELDVIFISETHLQPHHPDPKIPGFILYRTDRPTGPGGGTAIYISQSLKHHFTPITLVSLEATVITVSTSRGPITLASCYNRPSLKLDVNDLVTVINSGGAVIAAGDFNAKHTNWSCRTTNTNGKIVQQLIDNNINCQVYAPTEPTIFPANGALPDILDIAIVNNISHHLALTSVNELTSDHNPVLLDISNTIVESIPIKPMVNLGNFHDYLQDNFDAVPTISSCTDLDNAVTFLNRSIHEAIERNSFTNNRPRIRPNIPADILDLIREKNAARKISRRSNLPEDKRVTNRLNLEVKKALYNFRNQQWQAKLESLQTSDNSLWRMSKCLRTTKVRLAPIHSAQGIVYRDDEKAEAFAESLEGQCRLNLRHADLDHVEDIEDRVHGLITAPDDPDDEPILPTDIDEVNDIVKHLPSKKAPGPDQIPNKLLKALPANVIIFLVAIFNAMFSLRYFPSEWKKADVIFIPKPGKDHKFPQNHRPISLLSTVGKIAEKLILRRLSCIVDDLELIPKHQFGFRSQHSTTQQIVRLTEIASHGLNIKHLTGIISLDVEKAFDTVWHDGLIHKLLLQGIPFNLVKLIHSFLQNRSFRAKIGQSLSESHPLEAGVPQGSILSPLLYTLFTADMPLPQDHRVHLAAYADDTAIIAQSKDPHLLSTLLQDAADSLESFFKKWLIGVNPEKSCALIITRRRNIAAPKINMFGQDIPWTNQLKYLGVTFDKTLSFSPHIANALAKGKLAVNKLMPLLCRKSKMSLQNKLTLYKTIIRPMMVYASPAWAHASKNTIKPLQTLQNKCLRLIFQAPWFMRNDTLHNEANNLPTLFDYLIEASTKYFESADSHSNPLIREASSYDPSIKWKIKRPRSILI